MTYDPYRRGPSRGHEQQVPLHVAQRLQDERDQLYARLKQAGVQSGDRDRQLNEAYGVIDELREQLVQAREQLSQVREELAQAREQLSRAPELPQPDASSEDVASLTEQMEQYKRAAEQYAADLANLRRRMDDEIKRGRRDERIARLKGITSLHDALSRSLRQIQDTRSDWYLGNQALLKEVSAELARAGARPFAAVGEAFDPRLHEAVGAVPAGDHEPGSIVFVEQSGFRLPGGELVRPARVVVAAEQG